MAKLAGKQKISESEMSQEINLKRYLGRDATTEETQLFAELAIERINERTLDGKTIHGGNFKKYSEAYAEKKGVSRNSVDLFLSGDMLDSVDASGSGNSTVKIEMDDAKEAEIGFYHHTGDGSLKKRPWFGLTTSEARSITNDIKDTKVEKAKQSTTTLNELRDALALLGIEQES